MNDGGGIRRTSRPVRVRSTERSRRRRVPSLPSTAMPQGPELLIILFVIVLLFGGAKLPKLARSLGQAQQEFKHGLKTGATDDPDQPTAS